MGINLPSKKKLYSIVFGSSSKNGKRFDIILLWAILFSIIVVMFESIPQLSPQFRYTLFIVEWVLTIVFTIEYFLRIWISPKPMRYIFSFWGAIDLLSTIPTYLSFFLVGAHYLLVLRIFRLLRVFRILKLARFNSEAQILMNTLKRSSYKISIFLMTVLAIVTILGTFMYVVEGGREGFTSIPQSIYWAIVTVTTVGYGDLVPHTIIGKFISSIAMILGYAIIAVPTGIITVAMSKPSESDLNCPSCEESMSSNNNFCNTCGYQVKKD